MSTPVENLRAHLAPIENLKAAAAVLTWDQKTYMPDGAAEARAQQLSTLQSMAHERFVADETGELLDQAAEAFDDPDPLDPDAALVRVTRRDYERAVRVPSSLVAELSKARSQAQQAWQQARQNDDFSQFAPHLNRLVELSMEKAEAIGYEDEPYDPAGEVRGSPLAAEGGFGLIGSYLSALWTGASNLTKYPGFLIFSNKSSDLLAVLIIA